MTLVKKIDGSLCPRVTGSPFTIGVPSAVPMRTARTCSALRSNEQTKKQQQQQQHAATTTTENVWGDQKGNHHTDTHIKAWHVFRESTTELEARAHGAGAAVGVVRSWAAFTRRPPETREQKRRPSQVSLCVFFLSACPGLGGLSGLALCGADRSSRGRSRQETNKTPPQ